MGIRPCTIMPPPTKNRGAYLPYFVCAFFVEVRTPPTKAIGESDRTVTFNCCQQPDVLIDPVIRVRVG